MRVRNSGSGYRSRVDSGALLRVRASPEDSPDGAAADLNRRALERFIWTPPLTDCAVYARPVAAGSKAATPSPSPL